MVGYAVIDRQPGQWKAVHSIGAADPEGHSLGDSQVCTVARLHQADSKEEGADNTGVYVAALVAGVHHAALVGAKRWGQSCGDADEWEGRTGAGGVFALAAVRKREGQLDSKSYSLLVLHFEVQQHRFFWLVWKGRTKRATKEPEQTTRR